MMTTMTAQYREAALLRRFRTKNREAALLRRAKFLKKGLPGRVDTSGTKKRRLKLGNCGNVTFHDEKFKTGRST